MTRTARLARFLRTPFGLVALVCAVLAGWCTWLAGPLDGPMARDLRISSVFVSPAYAAATGVDESAAERVIGNRRLTVAFLEKGADVEAACQVSAQAVTGTVSLFLAPDATDDWDGYGCTQFDDASFARAYVADTKLRGGIDQFAGRPIETLHMLVINYDWLVGAGIAPDGSRTIVTPLPRYLIAGLALLAVIGAAVAFRRAGARIGTEIVRHRAHAADAHAERAAFEVTSTEVARRIIALDEIDAPDGGAAADRRVDQQRALAADYAGLLADVAAADRRGEVDPSARSRLDVLAKRSRRLSRRRRVRQQRVWPGRKQARLSR